MNVFLLSIILARGGLALVNEHQLHLPIVMFRAIPYWFRRHFVGTMFWYRETEATRLAIAGNRWLQFSNNGRRGKSRDQIIKIYFSNFLKFILLLYHTSLSHFFLHESHFSSMIMNSKKSHKWSLIKSVYPMKHTFNVFSHVWPHIFIFLGGGGGGLYSACMNNTTGL